MPQTWQRWEQELTSSRVYENPYAQVTVSVTYTGPAGQTIQSYGFWDGEERFKIRCAFPTPGNWRWQTICSDTTNSGLHERSGSVSVTSYRGANQLYRHGFLRVSANKRYLTLADGTPFLWMGDTAWRGPINATQADWEVYIRDRLAKGFSVIQVSPASSEAGATDRDGDPPFVGAGLSSWNPAYWRNFEKKVLFANQQGIAILLVGIMEPTGRYPSVSDARLFARNIVARLFGDFVLFSPSFDSPYQGIGDEVGAALRNATRIHLITQHPNTPSGQPTQTTADQYFDKPYMDFCSIQSGHNNGNRERCARQAIEWNLAAYNRQPHKPVLNIEAMYDGQGKNAWTADDARSLGYRSWLSGSLGYTYGAGETDRKVPGGSGGLYWWVKDPSKPDYWRKAMAWPSARQMQQMARLFGSIPWWQLEPAHDLIRNQPTDPIRQMVLSRSAAGDLIIAYLPDNPAIQIDVSPLPAGGWEGKWFNPISGAYKGVREPISGPGVHRFEHQETGDRILLLKKRGK
jgi:hypothetical protein